MVQSRAKTDTLAKKNNFNLLWLHKPSLPNLKDRYKSIVELCPINVKEKSALVKKKQTFILEITLTESRNMFTVRGI